jgi:histidinol phosphatase-like PHP family hydrolase
MTWRPVDCHAHSTYSDGALAIPQVVERAAALGVQPSVADHISRDVARAISSVDEVRAYLDELERYDILRGGEFCWHDSLWRELPDDLVARFTHRIGSLHAVRLPNDTLVHAFARRLPADLTPEDYMRAHLASLEQLAREMPVDILAHPTLVTLPFRSLPTDRLWTDDREARMIDAMHQARIAFEISNRYPPHERIVRLAVERGVRLSLGSDGHTRDQVANIAKPLAMARALGVADEDLYDPRRHGSRTQHSRTQRTQSSGR